MNEPISFRVTSHAVRQYRDRVIACPERSHSKADLRAVIAQQLSEYPMSVVRGAVVVTCGPWRPKKRKPWQMTVNYPTHMFVIDDRAVVTTLGFMMMPKKRINRRRRVERAKLVKEIAARLPGAALTP